MTAGAERPDHRATSRRRPPTMPARCPSPSSRAPPAGPGPHRVRPRRARASAPHGARWSTWFWRTLDIDRLSNGGVLAAAVAFRIFLLVIPLALTLITGLGLLADSASRLPQSLARQAGITGLIASAVGNAGGLTTFNRVVLVAGGAYASLKAAKSLLCVSDTAHALVWGDRSFPSGRRGRCWDCWACVSIVGLVLAIGRLRMATPGPGVVVTVVCGAIPIAGWCWASGRLPHGDAPRWALLPGAVLPAFGVQVVHLVTVYYLSRQVEGRSDTYGALGVAMAVLLWSYLVARLALVGAAVNAAAWQARRPFLGPTLRPTHSR